MIASSEHMVEHQLALGLELLDAARDMELVYPLRAEIEYGLPHIPPRPKRNYCFVQHRGQRPVMLTHHNSGRYSLVYQPSLKTYIDLRLYDTERRYVPRRLRVPLLSLQQVEGLEAEHSDDYLNGRVRTPVMHPGANYPLVGNATGLRGRVVHEGKVVRWAYIEARVQSVVMRARGDERGEFLLLLPPEVSSGNDLSAEIVVRVTVYGPSTTPVPATAEVASIDPLWDLPQEVIPQAGEADEVSSGKLLPAGYVQGAEQTVVLQVGRIMSGRDSDVFSFSSS